MTTTFTKALSFLVLSTALNLNATEPVSKATSISFTENKGQVCDQNYNARPDVLFSGNANGINFHLTSNGISYQLQKIDSWKYISDEKSDEKIKIPESTTIYRVDINWLGANPNSGLVKGEELFGVNNYYLKQCPNGALNVKSYSSLTYKNLYNGVDLKWYEKNGELEYDFIVKPKANYEQIKIEIKGQSKLFINKNGELEITTPLGTIIEKAPLAYQGNKVIPSKWQIKGNVASFKLNDYDKTQPLIIDPAIRKWGTYYGDVLDDYGRGCKTDASGNVFLTGYTANTTSTLIATSGSYQSVYGGGALDAFLAKFNSLGVRLWATYYGGTGNDVSLCMEVDGTSEYIAGYTTSTGTAIATAASHQPNTGGGNDGFLAKFDQNGIRVWATLYGGNGSDIINGCAKDASGNIYVAGNTTSNGAIAVGGHQNAYAGGGDAFLVKFNSSGVRQWGTYYGGATYLDQGNGCATDASGMVYLVGKTQTSTGSSIASLGHQIVFGGGGEDAYLAKFNSSGVRQWGTYYGGVGVDYGYGCTTDASGNVFMVGQTASATSTLIATAGSNQTTFGGSADAFFVKFNSSGTRQWGTYYGTNGLDNAASCTVDNSGNLLVVGSTNSSSGISTAGAHQVSLAGAYDGFIANVNKSTGQLVWGTYYGTGTGSDYSTGVCMDNIGYIFMSGYSNGAGGTGVATIGSHQSVASGLNDAFLAKFADCQSLTLNIASSSSTLCSGQSATLTASGLGFTTYTWNTGSNSTSISVSPSITTTYSLTAGTSTATCSFDGFYTLSVTPTPTVVVTPSTAVHCIGSSTTIISATGATTYSWSTGATTSSIAVTPSVYTIYTVTGYNGSCSSIKSSTLATAATPTVLVSGTPTQTFCSANSLTLTAFGASTYTWSSGSLTYSNVVSPTTLTSYTVVGSNGLCTDSYVVNVSPVITPTLNLSSSSPSICTGGSATLTSSGATTYSWNTGATTSSITVSPITNTNYTITGKNGACSDTKTISVGISTAINVLATASSTAICLGNTATLSANGASTYTWSTGSNSSSITVSPTVTTTYTIDGASGSCSGSAVISIQVNPCTGIQEIDSDEKINIYPNPNSGVFKLVVPVNGEYSVINSVGQVMCTFNVKDKTVPISVEGLANGIYFVIGKNAKTKIIVTD